MANAKLISIIYPPPQSESLQIGSLVEAKEHGKLRTGLITWVGSGGIYSVYVFLDRCIFAYPMESLKLLPRGTRATLEQE